MQIKIRYILLLLFLLSMCNELIAETKEVPDSANSTKFALSFSASGGASVLFNKSEMMKQKDFFFSPSIKFMWWSNTLLNIGIESSFLTLMNEEKVENSSEYGPTNFKAQMTAIPLSILFDMKIWGIDIYAGIGITFVNSTIDAFSTESKGNITAWNYIYGLSYNIPLSNSIAIGLDAKVFFITGINKYLASMGLNLSYYFYRW